MACVQPRVVVSHGAFSSGFDAIGGQHQHVAAGVRHLDQDDTMDVVQRLGFLRSLLVT